MVGTDIYTVTQLHKNATISFSTESGDKLNQLGIGTYWYVPEPTLARTSTLPSLVGITLLNRNLNHTAQLSIS